MNNLLRWDY